jgi:Xaa-Pro aminopeptidase
VVLVERVKLWYPGMSEQSLRAEFDYEFSKQGAPHAYEPIVAYDEQAVVLHKIGSLNTRLQDGAWALVDAGAEYAGYSADITRMLPLGKVPPRQREVCDAVERVLQACINELRPGLKFVDYARWAQEQVGQELVQLGLSKTASDKKAIRHYFPHLVSHSLGLDTHDVFNYHDVVLKENMVITVEPGIYIPEEGIGVRIEDDILITKTGAINLSKDIPY